MTILSSKGRALKAGVGDGKGKLKKRKQDSASWRAKQPGVVKTTITNKVDPQRGGGRIRKGAANRPKPGTTATVKPALKPTGKTAVNTVAANAPGGSRSGQKYRVMTASDGRYVHVYGHGKDAKKVYIRKSNTAQNEADAKLTGQTDKVKPLPNMKGNTLTDNNRQAKRRNIRTSSKKAAAKKLRQAKRRNRKRVRSTGSFSQTITY